LEEIDHKVLIALGSVKHLRLCVKIGG